MILYRPTDGDAHTQKIKYRPKTCFIMTKLGKKVSPCVTDIRTELCTHLEKRKIESIDASSVRTGRDFLLKIWDIIITVPLGIAIIDKSMSELTLSNVFYEIGMMQALGKETLVIKTTQTKIPSDFIRTDYVEYNDEFIEELEKYIDHFFSLPESYDAYAELLENNPLLAIDYLRRAYLISGEKAYRDKAKKIFNEASIEGRAKNSVEMLLVNF
jgi:hypothetical protein